MSINTPDRIPLKLVDAIDDYIEPDLDEIVPSLRQGAMDQAEFDALLRVNQLRREIVSRVTNIRSLRARAKRCLATIMEIDARQQGNDLEPWHRLDLEGRLEEAKARLFHCREAARQDALEISAFLLGLR